LQGLCPRCVARHAAGIFAARRSSSASPGKVESATETHEFGNYELVEEIARGGMGVVWKARQLSLNRIVAVKLMLAGKFSSPEFVQRFRAEAEAAANLQHPNIVAIHEVGEHQGQPYFSMDYVPGQNLSQLVGDKPLPGRRAAALLKTVAEAVHYAHQQGILHRDLKPANILIDESGEPRVTDFGLAKRFSSSGNPVPDSELTLTGQVLGTPAYASPEQAGGKRNFAGPASDVYSLGAIFYFMLTGRAPFVSDTLEETLRQVHEAEAVSPRLLNPAVPRDLETICLKCLSKEPRRRYGSASALGADLQRWLNHEPITARRVGPVAKTWRWCQRRPVIASLLLALHVVMAIGLGGILWQWRRAEQNARDAIGRLREAYLAQARANRLSGQPGQRFATLSAISNAVALNPPSEQRAQLRNQAIAAMSLPDLVPVWTLENTNATWNGGSIDLPRSRYALVTTNGRAEVRRVPDNSLLFQLPPRTVPAQLPLDFSPDGRFLAICYSNSQVAIWDLDTRAVTVEDRGEERVETLAFSPDSTRVAIAGTNSLTAVWDLTRRRLIRAITNEVRTQFVSFDPAGKRLAIGFYKNNTVVIVDAETGARLQVLAHPTSVRRADWHPRSWLSAALTVWFISGILTAECGPARRQKISVHVTMWPSITWAT
jgi:hypothetical protein